MSLKQELQHAYTSVVDIEKADSSLMKFPMEELEKDDEHFLRIQEERPCQQPFGNIANKIKKAAHQLTEKDKSLNRHHKRGNQSFEKLKKQSSPETPESWKQPAPLLPQEPTSVDEAHLANELRRDLGA
eukprot:CAMPEP_0170546046 /NCGR_PEP_ID=MMETSP0211-20121228/4421_1 /TAXON_ID=311385 /ORGANISM="Pseudokeronopsis sp., Strain OXSARD2" /LENGTH=128 /DNA_ID=CAMNT_0010850293 /DNA_START=107 /DNA_END=492 /DNA_ORIENTATION=+